MRITLNGAVHEIEPGQARARLAGHPAEPIQTHWVEMDDRRWPPKQALEVILGVQRADFTSHRASDILKSLGFRTSRDHVRPHPSARLSAPKVTHAAQTCPSRETLLAALTRSRNSALCRTDPASPEADRACSVSGATALPVASSSVCLSCSMKSAEKRCGRIVRQRADSVNLAI